MDVEEPHELISQEEQAPRSVDERSVVLGPTSVFVRWRPDVAGAFPELIDAIERFEPVPGEAGASCARWLREHALDTPAEATTRLLVADANLRGFYALANGEAELNYRSRAGLGVGRRTQPAVLLAQVARSKTAPAGTGRLLVDHAIGAARRGTEFSAATVFALDPYDESTQQMWMDEYGFRRSEAPPPGRTREDGLRRLWLPLEAAPQQD